MRIYEIQNKNKFKAEHHKKPTNALRIVISKQTSFNPLEMFLVSGQYYFPFLHDTSVGLIFNESGLILVFPPLQLVAATCCSLVDLSVNL